MRPVAGPIHIPFGQAVSRGFSLAWRAPGALALAFLADLGSAILEIGAATSLTALSLVSLFHLLFAPLPVDPGTGGGLLRSLIRAEPALAPAAGAALVALLLALALRLVWFSATTRLFAARLSGETATLSLYQARLERTVPVVGLFVAIYLALFFYGAALVGSTAALWSHAARTGRHGAGASASLALALVVALVLRLAVDLLFKLSLLRAAAADVGPVDALVGAGQLAAKRLGAVVGLVLVFAFFEGAAGVVAGAGNVFLGAGRAGIALAVAARILGGLVAALAWAYFSTAELGALVTLDCGERGALPEPPAPLPTPAPPTLETEPVLSTEVVHTAELH